MFCSTKRCTYGWSDSVYVAMRGDRANALSGEMPQPSSSTAGVNERMEVRKRRLVGEASHEAKDGVTFQRTAPVVPPLRSEERTEGDWWMVYSVEATVTSTERDLGSMKPRFWEGMGRV